MTPWHPFNWLTLWTVSIVCMNVSEWSRSRSQHGSSRPGSQGTTVWPADRMNESWNNMHILLDGGWLFCQYERHNCNVVLSLYDMKDHNIIIFFYNLVRWCFKGITERMNKRPLASIMPGYNIYRASLENVCFTIVNCTTWVWVDTCIHTAEK